MRIWVPRGVTPGESRAALAPHAVHELTRAGHRVPVETGDGGASSMADELYEDPAAVPFTATRALSNALLPYVREVAGRELADTLNSDAGLGRGVAVAEGRVVDPVLARATGTEHNLLSSVLPLHSGAR